MALPPAPTAAATRESRPLSRFLPVNAFTGVVNNSEAAADKKLCRCTVQCSHCCP